MAASARSIVPQGIRQVFATACVKFTAFIYFVPGRITSRCYGPIFRAFLAEISGLAARNGENWQKSSTDPLLPGAYACLDLRKIV
jgi:hypothetical protein